MKKLFLMTVIILTTVVAVHACDFNFTVVGGQKNCKAGDVIEVQVELTLVHRSCSVAASATKFKTEGVKVLSASEWKQVSPTKFVRTVKMQVLPTAKNKITLIATRTCDKEGGYGTFSLPLITK